jgi:hypothetical protein
LLRTENLLQDETIMMKMSEHQMTSVIDYQDFLRQFQQRFNHLLAGGKGGLKDIKSLIRQKEEIFNPGAARD